MDDQTLLLLASKYFSHDGCVSVRRLIAYGDYATVRSGILRAIDFALSQGDVEYDEAGKDYKLLGFSREEACAARQGKAAFHFRRP